MAISNDVKLLIVPVCEVRFDADKTFSCKASILIEPVLIELTDKVETPRYLAFILLMLRRFVLKYLILTWPAVNIGVLTEFALRILYDAVLAYSVEVVRIFVFKELTLVIAFITAELPIKVLTFVVVAVMKSTESCPVLSEPTCKKEVLIEKKLPEPVLIELVRT